MMINVNTKLCMVIGDPIDHSLSPVMHNAGFEALPELAGRFVYLTAGISRNDLKRIPEIMRVLHIRGISVTMPYKEEIMKYLLNSNLDRAAMEIGSVNTLLNDNGRIRGLNTDCFGIVNALKGKISLEGKRVAVIGAGGLAKAACYAFSKAHCRIKINNRTMKRAAVLAETFNAKVIPMDKLAELKQADLIFNATPVGMVPDHGRSPVPEKYIRPGQLIFDSVYHPAETKLLYDAKQKGAETISGLELLLGQGIAQFELFTGKKAPEEVMRKALLSNITHYAQ